MTIRHLVFAFFLFTIACQSEQQQYRSEITRLEESLETELNEATAEELLTKYAQYAETYPDDGEQIADYAGNRAQLLSRLGRHREAAHVLLASLEKMPTADNAVQLAQLFEERLNAYQAARTVYQLADTDFPENEAIQAKLNADWAPINARLDTLRMDVFNEDTGRLDERAARDFIFSVATHTALRPSDRQTPDLLFEAADVAGALRDYERALEIYERINTSYADYQKAPEALFMRAFTLDAELKRYDEAKVYYEEFLEQYPDHELAPSAKFSLENLGKSEEEIIQGFMEKQEDSLQ